MARGCAYVTDEPRRNRGWRHAPAATMTDRSYLILDRPCISRTGKCTLTGSLTMWPKLKTLILRVTPAVAKNSSSLQRCGQCARRPPEPAVRRSEHIEDSHDPRTLRSAPVKLDARYDGGAVEHVAVFERRQDLKAGVPREARQVVGKVLETSGFVHICHKRRAARHVRTASIQARQCTRLRQAPTKPWPRRHSKYEDCRSAKCSCTRLFLLVTASSTADGRTLTLASSTPSNASPSVLTASWPTQSPPTNPVHLAR